MPLYHCFCVGTRASHLYALFYVTAQIVPLFFIYLYFVFSFFLPSPTCISSFSDVSSHGFVSISSYLLLHTRRCMTTPPPLFFAASSSFSVLFLSLYTPLFLICHFMDRLFGLRLQSSPVCLYICL